MKFTAKNQVLSRGLQIISSVVPSNPIIPIIRDVKFELCGDLLKLTGTDMQNALVTSIEVSGEEDGQICFDGKLLLNILKSMDDEDIHVELQDATIKIVTKDGQYELPTNYAKEFPRLPTIDSLNKAEFTADFLKDALTKTIYAIAVESAQVIDNLLLRFDSNEFIMASSNKVLIAEVATEYRTEFKGSILVNKKSAILLKSLLSSGPVFLTFNEAYALFELGNMSIYVRLSEGMFPDHRSVFNNFKYTNKLTIERMPLIMTIKRLLLITTSAVNEVKIKYSSETLELTCEDQDYKRSAKETLPGEYLGDGIVVGYNGKQLLEILSAIPQDFVTMSFANHFHPTIIKPVEPDGYTVLTSPVNL